MPRIPRHGRPWLAWATLALVACGGSDTSPAGPPDTTGPDLDLLFAPATAAEVAAVRADWATRSRQAVDVAVEDAGTLSLAGTPARLRIVSHRVDGRMHHGAVVTPPTEPGTRLPVVVYTHTGLGDVSVDELQLVALGLGPTASSFAYVVPAFRGNALSWQGREWRTEGDASPWDRDVDDGLSLLEAVSERIPEVDVDRLGVLGFSGGGTVAMLLAVREPRVDRVVSFFAPADFFGTYVRDVVASSLAGAPPDLPGIDLLNERFIQPLGAGTLSVQDIRAELARRSVVLFADNLPSIQVHHGTEDVVVAVSQSRRLEEALQARGTGGAPFQVFFYEGGGHDPLGLPGSFSRARGFLSELLEL